MQDNQLDTPNQQDTPTTTPAPETPSVAPAVEQPTLESVAPAAPTDPVEQPQPAPQPQQPEQPQQAQSKKAYMFGLLSIALVFLPLVPIILGILAIVYARKDGKAAQARGKKLSPLPIFLGCAGIFLALISNGVIGARIIESAGSFIPVINSTIANESEYPKQAEAVETAKKTFTTGETLEFGPLDVKTVSVAQNYVPSESELAYLDVKQKSWSNNTSESAKERNGAQFGWSLANPQYVQVTLSVSENQARKDALKNLSFSSGDWAERLRAASLDGVDPVITYINKEEAGSSRDFSKQIDAMLSDPGTAEVMYVFRAPAGKQSGTLELTITPFTKVSPIVGTEGMPTKLYNYTLGLW